ncbi:MAG: hypothetical protein TEF_20470 [Rhizobiales bacterium NRL2]|jgi:NAD(P)-dependent dehydrogenase (short-subunit alcohol dehydrogenase family)|nr:MAG: hypothetical protein TEF_20470 [Rhizobiales bacterium NRL2]
MSRTILITGAGRGIGRALAEHYLDKGETVLATARDTGDLADLVERGAEAFELEVTDQTRIDRLAADLGDRPIDVLINNAGVIGGKGPQTLSNLNQDDWAETMRINVFAPFRITEALVGNITASAGKTVAIISSRMGSIDQNASSEKIVYRTSKAAVNQVAKALHNGLHSQGVKVVPLHPGWVATDMGGPSAAVTPRDSARGLAGVIDNLRQDQSGRFWDYQGQELPW